MRLCPKVELGLTQLIQMYNPKNGAGLKMQRAHLRFDLSIKMTRHGATSVRALAPSPD